MRPPELREPTAATVGSDQTPLRDTVSREQYRQDSRSASRKPLRLIHDGDDLKGRVLRKAGQQVRREPQTLPLWALRLAQHVNRGTYGYQRAWNVLERAAVAGGASEAWADRVLYRGFADSITMDADAMPLTVLAGGVQ